MPLLHTLFKMLASRWFLIPLALMIGFAGGLLAALAYALPVVNAGFANRAVTFLDIAAEIDSGNLPAARQNARASATIAIDALARNGATGPEFNVCWRNITTYNALAPGMTFTPTADALLKAMPPFTSRELATSGCASGIGTLARAKERHGP